MNDKISAAPTVSILINNYNYGRFLRQAIDSALSQTYAKTEIVVVDDGSTDESPEIIRTYGEKIRAIFKSNGGQASAFNAGFAHSSGDIIAFLDSDDYLSPKAVERIVSLWRDDVDILHHRLCLVDQAGNKLGYKPPPEQVLDSGNVVPIILEKNSYGNPPTSGLVYSRKLLVKLLPIPEEKFRICADIHLIVCAPFFSSVQVTEETLGYYRLHDSNAWSTGKRRLLRRSTLERQHRYMRIYRELVRSMAAERGLSVSPVRDRKLSSGERLERQIINRTDSTEIEHENNAALAFKTFRAAWSETEKERFDIRLKLSLLCLIVWLAPRSILARIYPNMFEESP